MRARRVGALCALLLLVCLQLGFATEVSNRRTLLQDSVLVGVTTVELTAALARSSETNIGDLVCEAIVDYVRTQVNLAGTAEAACLINGGSFNTSISIPVGPVTTGDLKKILPFSNKISALSIRGVDLLTALVNGFSRLGGTSGTGRFPQVSGMHLVVNADAAPPSNGTGNTTASRPRLAKAKLLAFDGTEKEIDPCATYMIITNDYLAGGGDGYATFLMSSQNHPIGNVSINDVVANYISKKSPISPTLDGRIANCAIVNNTACAAPEPIQWECPGPLYCGMSKDLLDYTLVRSNEANIGDLLCDAMRVGPISIDACLVNGGSINASIPAGQITTDNLKLSFPRNNVAVILSVKGSDLLLALANGVSALGGTSGTGRFPQVSGLRYVVNPAAAPPNTNDTSGGMARLAKAVLVGADGTERPIDPCANYTVATNDYLAGGGDGYVTFNSSVQLVPKGETIVKIVGDYIFRNTPVSAPLDGRIVNCNTTNNTACVTPQPIAWTCPVDTLWGVSTVPLDPTLSLSTETNVADLTCAALMDYARAFPDPSVAAVDACLINGGLFNASVVVPAGNIKQSDLRALFPYPDDAVVLRLKGSDLLAALANGVTAYGGDSDRGCFPQVAAIRYGFNAALAPSNISDLASGMARLVKANILGKDGSEKPIDPCASYTIVTNSYLAGGGDGYVMFNSSAHLLPKGETIDKIVGDYISRKSPVSPSLDGRIVNCNITSDVVCVTPQPIAWTCPADTLWGVSTVPLDPTLSLSTETNVADLTCAALMYYARTFPDPSVAAVDACLINGGLFNASIVVPAGNITQSNLRALIPYKDGATVLNLKGSDLLAALANGLTAYGGDSDRGCFPQVAGIRYVFNATLAPSNISDLASGKARLLRATILGKDGSEKTIDPCVNYTIVTNSYLAAGNDGYTMFSTSKHLMTSGDDVTGILGQFIKEQTPVSPALDGRVTNCNITSDLACSAPPAVQFECTGGNSSDVIGELLVPLDNTLVRSNETAAADMVCDALFESAKAKGLLPAKGVSVCLINAGMMVNGTWPAGPVTEAALEYGLPHNNTVAVITIRGSDLLAALANGVSALGGTSGTGRFPQVAGLHYVVNADKAPANAGDIATGRLRLAKAKVLVGGKERNIDPCAMYTVVTNDYLAAGGDGYVMFNTSKATMGDSAVQALSDYISKHSPLAPAMDGRAANCALSSDPTCKKPQAIKFHCSPGNEIIGEFLIPVDNTLVRSNETAAADLVCDALFESAKVKGLLPAKGISVCLVNAGMMVNGTWPAGPIPQSAVPYGLPYNNTVAVITIKGSDLLLALANGVSALGGTSGTGRFPQVAGLHYVVNADKAPPKPGDIATGKLRLAKARVVVGGKERNIDPCAMYTVVTNDYLAGGGDGYVMFNTTKATMGETAVKAVSNYITKNSPLAPAMDGRVINCALSSDPTCKKPQGLKYDCTSGGNTTDVIGTFLIPVDNTLVRSNETAAADLVCDALFESAKVKGLLPAKGISVCLVNAGMMVNGTWPAGPVTQAAVEYGLPHNNTVAVITIKGSDLLAALANGVSALGGTSGTGRFPQVAGLRYVVNADKAPPNAGDIATGKKRLTKAKVVVGSKERNIDPCAMYTVVTNDYLAAGGDGYVMFNKSQAAMGDSAVKAVSDYITKNSPLAPAMDGRVVNCALSSDPTCKKPQAIGWICRSGGGAVVGVTKVALDYTNARSNETNIGDLLCDSMVAYAKGAAPSIKHADACLVNGGMFNASIPAGDVTKDALKAAMPYNSTAVVIVLKGSDLLAALANGVSAYGGEKGTGRFPQIAGLRVVVNPALAPPNTTDTSAARPRVAKAKLLVDGIEKLINPCANYTIVTNDYLAGGGDGYTMFGTATQLLPKGKLLVDVMGEYITKNSPVEPLLDGRLTNCAVTSGDTACKKSQVIKWDCKARRLMAA